MPSQNPAGWVWRCLHCPVANAQHAPCVALAHKCLAAWLQVMAMTNLVAAYQANNIKEFEKILAHNK